MANDDSNAGLQDEIEQLKRDLIKVQSDLRDIADHLVNQSRQQAQQMRSRVEDQVESSLESLQECLQRRPIATLATAFVVGMVASKFFGRR